MIWGKVMVCLVRLRSVCIFVFIVMWCKLWWELIVKVICLE